MIYSVPKVWPGETCVLLAGGPSLRDTDLKPLKQLHAQQTGLHIITINDSWQLHPYSDFQYFCDRAWWDYEQARNPRSLYSDLYADLSFSFHDMIYRGRWITCSNDFTEHPQVRHLRLTGQSGLELDPTGLRHGSNSGYQAINLAVNFGVSKVILLGYDMRIVKGRTHWHNEARQSDFESVMQRSMLPLFPSLIEPLDKLGVRVINATKESALTCFPMMSLEEALKC